MMELGNLLMGHSRGNVEIPRSAGYEHELFRLFEAVDPTRDNGWREYGVDFSNETFSILPYYWGDCNCGYDEKEIAWSDSHKHSSFCYQTEYATLPNDKRETWRKRTSGVKALCLKHGIDWNGGSGYAVHCTCSYQKEWERFVRENDHDKSCPIVKPNFEHFPSDYQLMWYKYPLRNSYASKKLSLREFSKMIDNCIESL